MNSIRVPGSPFFQSAGMAVMYGEASRYVCTIPHLYKGADVRINIETAAIVTTAVMHCLTIVARALFLLNAESACIARWCAGSEWL
jgi:hypothetical protein